MPNPKLMPEAFCSNGLKNNIPATRTSGTADNAVTYLDGFPQITMTPTAAGGKPPSGKDMNGILHEITAHIVHLNKGNVYQFDRDFAEKIGGYPKGAVLINDQLDALFLSITDRNKTNFNNSAFAGKWREFSIPPINNLQSTKTDAPLSAAMGKKLADEKLNADDLKFTRLPVAAGSAAVELDLTSRASIIAALGDKYIANGHVQAVYHNTEANHNIRGLPLTQRSPVQLDFYFMGGYSFIDCHYIALRRMFRARVNFNNETLEPGWKENLTEENGVMLTGAQTVAGAKTFTNTAEFSGGIRLGGGGKSEVSALGVGASDVYLRNATSNRYLQLKDDGTLAYSNQKIYHEGNKPRWDDIQNKPNIAMRGTKLAHYGITDSVTDSDFQWSKVQTGTVAYFVGDAAPFGWLAANGAQVPRASFPHLFRITGTRYGAGNGSTTFTLPDLRGEFVRGWDAGRGVNPGRNLGSFEGQSTESHWHGVGVVGNGNDDAMFIERSWGVGYNGIMRHIYGELNREARDTKSGGNLGTGDAIGHSGETRPRNVALLACIKA